MKQRTILFVLAVTWLVIKPVMADDNIQLMKLQSEMLRLISTADRD